MWGTKIGRSRRAVQVVVGIALAAMLSGCSDQSLREYFSGQPEPELEDQLADASVTTPKRVDGVDLCSLLTRSEVIAAMGREPLGPPERNPRGAFCSWKFATSLPDSLDSIMVTSAGRMQGRKTTIRGNSALLTRTPSACVATVAVEELQQGRVSVEQLAVRYTNMHTPNDRDCRRAADLLRRAFDRLPPA